MAQVEQIRHSIIDKLLSIDNKELLFALNKILESKSEDLITLTKEQKEMLQMSNDDIAKGRIISQSDIDKQDSEWLN